MNKLKDMAPANLDAVILCGGKGSRLKRAVSDRPKPMADIRGRPFLDILITYAASFGFKRFILCAGHMGRFIDDYYSGRNAASARVIVSHEDKPLGTAGALKNAKPLINSSPFLVMNGDSLCMVNLRKFVDFYKTKKARFSMVLASPALASDYGSVGADRSGRITAFNEKTKAHRTGFINAGIYLLDQRIFKRIPSGKRSSLERDIFPNITGAGFFGYKTKAKVIDIGTPARYVAAKNITDWRYHEER